MDAAVEIKLETFSNTSSKGCISSYASVNIQAVWKSHNYKHR